MTAPQPIEDALFRKALREFLRTRGSTPMLDGFADSDSLLEAGIIDSLSMVDLIAFLHKNYAQAVTDADLVPENFDSIDAIVAFISRRAGHP